MAEMYNTIYFKHPDEDIQAKLMELFDDERSEEQFIEMVSDIVPNKGKKIAEQFILDVCKKYAEGLYFGPVEEQHGYAVVEWMTGGGGDNILGRAIRFLYRLCPEIHAQGFGMGDDDPWEYWFKFENQKLYRVDDEPYNESDERIRGTVYRWWHETLPEGISEGMLNDEDEDDDDEVDVEDEPVTEEEYQSWLKYIEPKEQALQDIEEIANEQVVESMISSIGSIFGGKKKINKPEATVKEDVVDDAEVDALAKELMGSFGDLLGGLFGGGNAAGGSISSDAIDASKLDEAVIDKLFSKVKEAEDNFDSAEIMKHLSSDFSLYTKMYGHDAEVPVNYGLYKASLKMLLRKELEYSNDYTVTGMEISDDGQSAAVTADSVTAYIDPAKKVRTISEATTEYEIEIRDAKVVITGGSSVETLNRPAPKTGTDPN